MTWPSAGRIKEDRQLHNRCLIFDPEGRYISQPKLPITLAENRYLGISSGSGLIVPPTLLAKVGVQIGSDIEFSEAIAGVIGNLPSVPAIGIHYRQVAVFTPSDFEFARADPGAGDLASPIAASKLPFRPGAAHVSLPPSYGW